MVGISSDTLKDMLYAVTDCFKSCNMNFEKSFLDQQIAKPTPTTLYHYTDSIGLHGILHTGNIRLTDIFNLNDPSELRHSIDHAMKTYVKEVEDDPASQSFVYGLKKMMDSDFENLSRFFVASFSSDGDDLGQWRAYGDNGSGFALGFDGDLLVKAFMDLNTQTQDFNNGVFHIDYSDILLIEHYQQGIKKYLPVINMPIESGLDSTRRKLFINKLIENLITNTIYPAIYFKHKAYVNEKEYRFLQVRSIDKPVDDLRHRPRGYSLIDFYNFDWKINGLNVLREIVIGPAADEKYARSFASKCLLANGINLEELNIYKSDIPYRS